METEMKTGTTISERGFAMPMGPSNTKLPITFMRGAVRHFNFCQFDRHERASRDGDLYFLLFIVS